MSDQLQTFLSRVNAIKKHLKEASDLVYLSINKHCY